MGAWLGICVGIHVHGAGWGSCAGPGNIGGHGLQWRDKQCHSQPQRHQIFR
jgi:hypothetical protein